MKRTQEELRIRQRLWKKNNPEKVKANKRRGHLKATYGITEKDVDALLFEQSGRCGICGSVFSKENMPRVDHNHETLVIRGLLCDPCNWGLGHFRDSYDNLIRASTYLGRHKNKIL